VPTKGLALSSVSKQPGRPPGCQEKVYRPAARPPRKSPQARPEKPAGPVWRENQFFTTTATQLGRGLSDGGCTEIQG